MHGPINVKSPNNISRWQMGFNSAFKGLKGPEILTTLDVQERIKKEHLRVALRIPGEGGGGFLT
jgi:hypothetical protein